MEFISFKYLDDDGSLRQYDAASRNVSSDLIVHGANHPKLIPIKQFCDPFRSYPTLSIFCVNAEGLKKRDFLTKIEAFNAPVDAHISFWRTPNSQANGDIYTDLRSEILKNLEELDIVTTIHYYKKITCQNVVGMVCKNILEVIDNVVIARYLIENLATGYGFEVAFENENNVNLTLNFLQSNQMQEIELLKIMGSYIEDASGSRLEMQLPREVNYYNYFVSLLSKQKSTGL